MSTSKVNRRVTAGVRAAINSCVFLLLVCVRREVAWFLRGPRYYSGFIGRWLPSFALFQPF